MVNKAGGAPFGDKNTRRTLGEHGWNTEHQVNTETSHEQRTQTEQTKNAEERDYALRTHGIPVRKHKNK